MWAAHTKLHQTCILSRHQIYIQLGMKTAGRYISRARHGGKKKKAKQIYSFSE